MISENQSWELAYEKITSREQALEFAARLSEEVELEQSERLSILNARALYRGESLLALAEWQRISESFPHNHQGWLLFSRLMVKQSGMEGAEKVISSASRYLTVSASGTEVLSRMYEDSGDFGAAGATLQFAAEQWPNEAQPLLALSKLNQRQARIEAAYWFVDQALIREPNDSASLEQFAELAGLLEAVDIDTGHIRICGIPSVSEDVFGRLISKIVHRTRNIQHRKHFNVRPGHVALMTSTLGPGGAERQLAKTAIGFHASDSSVSVVANDLESRKQGDFFVAELTAAGVPIVNAASIHDPNWIKQVDPEIAELLTLLPSALVASVGNYASAIVRDRPEKVYAWQDATCIRAGLAARILGVPILAFSVRSLPPHTRNLGAAYFQEAIKALIAGGDVRFSCNSTVGGKAYADWLSLPSARVSIIPNACEDDETPVRKEDSAVYEEWQNQCRSKVIVGTVMRFDTNKMPIFWLETAALLEPDVGFIMVGEGPLFEKAKGMATKLGIAERVLFTGYSSNPRFWIRQMDLFLLVSKIEGLPNTLIEAQWEGVPVLTTLAGGVVDAIPPGTIGHNLITSAESDSATALSQKIRLLTANPDHLRLLGQQAATYVRERFDVEKVIEQHRNLLN